MARQPALLGYVFGFKETSKENDNSFKVSFYSGVSQKFPSEHAKKKDFYADEVRNGDASEIYINHDLAYEVFKQEFAGNMPDNLEAPSEEVSFYEGLFVERAARFEYPLNLEQFIALTSFSMIGLHFPLIRFESAEDRDDLLKKCVGPYFERSAIPVVDAFLDHQRVNAEIYEEELESVLGPLKI